MKVKHLVALAGNDATFVNGKPMERPQDEAQLDGERSRSRRRTVAAFDAETGKGWAVWAVDDADETINLKIGNGYDGPLPRFR